MNGGNTDNKTSVQKWKWNQFPSITKAEDMVEYLNDRPYGHGQYCHYTTLDIIDSIIKNKTFWISNVTRANDEQDKSQFASHENEYYMLCWSTGTNENLPMWYMYGGIDGKGGRIRLTKDAVRKLNEEGVYKLYKKDGEKLGDYVMDLKEGESMRCEFQDILYMRVAPRTPNDENRKVNSKKDEENEIKYNTMINRKMPLQEQEKIRKQERMHFVKSLIWFYEKETRLLVQLIGDAKEKVQEGGEYVVTLSFPPKGKFNINIDLAPEVGITDEECQKHPNICDRSISVSVHQSEYYNEPHMDLCRKCKYKPQQQSKPGKTNENPL